MNAQNDPAASLPSGVSLGWAGPDDALDDTRLWLRVGVAEMTIIRVLSAAPLFYPGHWFPATRSYRLCTYPACQFCAVRGGGGAETRKMASERRIRHLVAVQGHSGEQRIWEFGDAVAQQMKRLTGYEREGDQVRRSCELRGLALGLCREGGRQAGAVLVSPAPAGITWPDYIPEPLDVAGQLAAAWRRAALKDGKGQPRLPVGF